MLYGGYKTQDNSPGKIFNSFLCLLHCCVWSHCWADKCYSLSFHSLDQYTLVLVYLHLLEAHVQGLTIYFAPEVHTALSKQDQCWPTLCFQLLSTQLLFWGSSGRT